MKLDKVILCRDEKENLGMNKSQYRIAYEFVRATMEANLSDLDYQVATCQFREQCANGDYLTCQCDWDGNLYELRMQRIREIRKNGITDDEIRLAADHYYKLRTHTDKERQLDNLHRKLQVASKRKLYSRISHQE